MNFPLIFTDLNDEGKNITLGSSIHDNTAEYCIEHQQRDSSKKKKASISRLLNPQN
jgi:hypothetical protein